MKGLLGPWVRVGGPTFTGVGGGGGAALLGGGKYFLFYFYFYFILKNINFHYIYIYIYSESRRAREMSRGPATSHTFVFLSPPPTFPPLTREILQKKKNREEEYGHSLRPSSFEDRLEWAVPTLGHRPRLANPPRAPLGGPIGGLHGFSWGPPPDFSRGWPPVHFRPHLSSPPFPIVWMGGGMRKGRGGEKSGGGKVGGGVPKKGVGALGGGEKSGGGEKKEK
nr:hypothetical protein [Morchella crassipes]